MRKRQKLLTIRQENGWITKLRLIAWVRNPYGIVWLASVATGKSQRQVNDWLNRRTRKKSVQQLDSKLTKALGYMGHAVVMDQVRQWCDELSPNHAIAFRCESAEPEKQFRVWGRWLLNKEKRHKWVADENFLSFYYHKN